MVARSPHATHCFALFAGSTLLSFSPRPVAVCCEIPGEISGVWRYQEGAGHSHATKDQLGLDVEEPRHLADNSGVGELKPHLE